MTQPIKTPIEPGIVARVAAGLRLMVTGKAPDWFGPMDPLPEMVPENQKPSVVGRQFDFPVGINTQSRPRTGEAITFDQMRALADNYDILRLVIETRKDQMEKLQWHIKPKDDKAKPDDRCEELTKFFKKPDREHNWSTWLRMMLEDLLVIDAPTLYPRMTLGNGLYALEPVDGATIKRVLDEFGRTPMPPDPAYQQILKGVPAISGLVQQKEWLTADDCCEECQDMNGKLAPIDGTFEGGADVPLHPHCRCNVLPVIDEKESLAKAFNPDQPRDEHGRWSGGGGISGFVQRALRSPGDKQQSHDLSKVSATAAQKASAIGVSIEGKSVALSHDLTIHAIRQHGGKSERSRGQVPITHRDLSITPRILERGEHERGTPPNARNGSPRIKVTYTSAHFTYTAIFESRRTQVMPVTIHKKANRTA